MTWLLRYAGKSPAVAVSSQWKPQGIRCRPARPPYSVLNKSKIKEVYGVEVPYWRVSLERCIKDLL